MKKVLVVEDKVEEMDTVKAEIAKSNIEAGFLFASNLKEAVEIFKSGVDEVITDLFYPAGGNVPKFLIETLGKELAWFTPSKGQEYYKNLVNEDEIPYGIILALLAREKNLPVVFVSSHEHHSEKSNFLTMMCRSGWFNEDYFVEGLENNHKRWSEALEISLKANYKLLDEHEIEALTSIATAIARAK